MDIDGESFAKINVSSYKTGFDNKNKEEVVRDIALAYDTAMAYKELYENLNTSYAELEEKFHSRKGTSLARPDYFERTQLNFRLQQLVAMFRRAWGLGGVASGLLNVGTQQQYTATMPPVQQVQTQFQQPSIFDKLKMGFLMGVRSQYSISQWSRGDFDVHYYNRSIY